MPDPSTSRPGHLLDILGEVGAFRVQQAPAFTDRDDGTGPGLMVPVVLARLSREAHARHGVPAYRADTWALRMLCYLADVCMETDPDLIRVELVQLLAAGTAWVEVLDTREAL